MVMVISHVWIQEEHGIHSDTRKLSYLENEKSHAEKLDTTIIFFYLLSVVGIEDELFLCFFSAEGSEGSIKKDKQSIHVNISASGGAVAVK